MTPDNQPALPTWEEVQAMCRKLDRVCDSISEVRALIEASYEPIPHTEADATAFVPGPVLYVAEGATLGERQYFYRVNDCRADRASAPDCICWHDEGTGPLADGSAKAWRVKPSNTAQRVAAGDEILRMCDLADKQGIGTLTTGYLREAISTPPPTGKAVAEIGPGWTLVFAGSEPIARIAERHGLHVGTKLYTHPAAQDEGMVMIPKAEFVRALESIQVPEMSPLKQELFKAGTHAVIRAFNKVISDHDPAALTAPVDVGGELRS